VSIQFFLKWEILSHKLGILEQKFTEKKKNSTNLFSGVDNAPCYDVAGFDTICKV